MLMPDPAHPSVPHHLPLPLDRLVTAVDATIGDHADVADGGALLRVTGHPAEVAALPLGGDHPLDMLLGFTAPAHWRAVGLHCRARAYDLPSLDGTTEREAATPLDGSDEREPVRVTVLVGRSGAGSGLLRRGPAATRLPGAPEGMVGDACRRALGLPTPPPPPSTAELWLRVWLDRVVEAATGAGGPGELSSWPAVAALHPAAPARSPATAPPLPPRLPGEVGFGNPDTLAETTHVLASAWPWARLRHDPEVVDSAQPPVPPQVAGWMDDGMFARWVLADFADLALLSRTVHALLPPAVAAAVDATVLACGLRGAPASPQQVP